MLALARVSALASEAVLVAANDNFHLRLVCDNGILITQKRTSGGSASTLASSIAYEPFGPWTSLTNGNGIVETPTRDADYRITGLKDIGTATVYNVTYALNAGDIPATYTDNLTAANTIIDMGFTATVSLTQFNTPGTSTRTFTYDSNGNRKSYSGVATSYTYNPGTNQLATIVGSSGTTTVTTNAAGNITGFSPGFGPAAVTGLSYNNGGRLTSVSSASGTLGAYVYDAFGQRFSKVAGGATILYKYSGSTLLAETSGGVETDYFYLNGRPLAMLTGTTFNWLHDDHIGTPMVATNASQAVVWKASYLPFGETIATSGTATVNLRFAGQYYDAETGFNHNGLRDYVPVLGRYLETDPLGIVTTAGLYSDLNTYVYAGGTPMSLIDPWGLTTEHRQIVRRSADGKRCFGPDNGEFACPDDQGGGADQRSFYQQWKDWNACGLGGPGNACPPPPSLSLRDLFFLIVAIDTDGVSALDEGALADVDAAEGAVDPNKLNHIFGNSAHNLDPLVEQYGSQEAAYNGIDQAVSTQLGTGGTGTFSTVVNVGGTNVTVTGAFVNGVPRIGTAYIP
jgi:RHS repeat-associated protein